jgi:hypothetical protein
VRLRLSRRRSRLGAGVMFRGDIQITVVGKEYPKTARFRAMNSVWSRLVTNLRSWPFPAFVRSMPVSLGPCQRTGREFQDPAGFSHQLRPSFRFRASTPPGCLNLGPPGWRATCGRNVPRGTHAAS